MEWVIRAGKWNRKTSTWIEPSGDVKRILLREKATGDDWSSVVHFQDEESRCSGHARGVVVDATLIGSSDLELAIAAVRLASKKKPCLKLYSTVVGDNHVFKQECQRVIDALEWNSGGRYLQRNGRRNIVFSAFIRHSVAVLICGITSLAKDGE